VDIDAARRSPASISIFSENTIMDGNLITFYILAAVAVGAALGMLFSKNAIYSALFLILNFAVAAVFYLILGAPFIAMAQITVYAGAIMVLFLFVVMLLGAEQLQGPVEGAAGRWQMPLSVLLALVLLGTLGYVFVTGATAGGAAEAAVDAGPAAIGMALFEAYVFPFEVASILLLVAMIGVVVLRTKRGRNA
jgi:NADH-quinone oxidoreductase subunit J